MVNRHTLAQQALQCTSLTSSMKSIIVRTQRQASLRWKNAAGAVITRPLSRSSSSSSDAGAVEEETDVLIVGGGVVGCSLADLIRHRLPHLSVSLVEAGAPPATTISNENNDDPPHPRSYALSPASLDLLRLLRSKDDASAKIFRNRLGFYDRMQIWEHQSPAMLSFSTADLPKAQRQESSCCLGACVEDRVLMQELWSRLIDTSSSNNAKTTFHNETTVSRLELPSPADGLVRAHLSSSLSPDKQKPVVVHTKLLVAADGANSSIRKMLGVPFAGWDYGRQALTFTVELSGDNNDNMEGRAFQRFLPTGPMALLPTYSSRHAVVVWSTTPALVEQWKNHPDLVHHINEILQQGPQRLESLFPSFSDTTVLSNLAYGLNKLVETAQYGPALAAQQLREQPFVPPPVVSKVVSPQFSFPLSCRQVHTYVPHPRVALVGDAAHTVHPLAGQGLNLGLADVAELLSVLEKASGDAGMDCSTFVAIDYHRRRHQVSAALAAVHALHAAFGTEHVAAQHVKSAGMNLLQSVGPLRTLLVQAATQGGLPMWGQR